MSYRNPFITSFFYDDSERERVLAAFTKLGWTAAAEGSYIHGLHSRSWPGALVGEEIAYLADAFVEAGVTGEVCVTFAAEADEDRAILVFAGGRFAVTTANAKWQQIP